MRALTCAGREGADFVLALGGGSVIDTAKAIAAGVPYDGDFWDFFSTRTPDTILPVGVVLTLSATGSEGSDSCVITHEKGNLKWGNKKSDLYRPKFARDEPPLHLHPASLSDRPAALWTCWPTSASGTSPTRRTWS